MVAIVTLEFYEDVAATEDDCEAFEHSSGLQFCGRAIVALTVDGGERTFVAAGEADEAGCVGAEFFVGGEGKFGFTGLCGDVAELGVGDEAAEVLITGAVFGEEGEAVSRFVLLDGVDFCPNKSADAVFFGGVVEARGAVNAMSIGDGHGGLIEKRAAGSKVFG